MIKKTTGAGPDNRQEGIMKEKRDIIGMILFFVLSILSVPVCFFVAAWSVHLWCWLIGIGIE